MRRAAWSPPSATIAGTTIEAATAAEILGVFAGSWAPPSKLDHVLAQLSHQTKKYDLKSKHCGAQSDLGTTRAKVVEALTEVRRAKIDGPALIFDD